MTPRRLLATEFTTYGKFRSWAGDGSRPQLGTMSVAVDERAPAPPSRSAPTSRPASAAGIPR